LLSQKEETAGGGFQAEYAEALTAERQAWARLSGLAPGSRAHVDAQRVWLAAASRLVDLGLCAAAHDPEPGKR